MGATKDSERNPTGTSEALGKSFLRKEMCSWDCPQSVFPDRGGKDRYTENQSMEDKCLTLGSVLEAHVVNTPSPEAFADITYTYCPLGSGTMVGWFIWCKILHTGF